MTDEPTATVRNLDRAVTTMHSARADLRKAVEFGRFEHGCAEHIRFEWALVVVLDELRPLVNRNESAAELWTDGSLDAIKRNAGRPVEQQVEAAGRTTATVTKVEPMHLDSNRLLEAAAVTDEIVDELGFGPEIETNREFELAYEETEPTE